jgi:hypothetical protein
MKSVINMPLRNTLRNTFLCHLVGLVLLTVFPTSVISQELTSSVDRNQISINETLTLTLRYDDRAGGDDVDLEALRQDFDILSVRPQTSNSVSIVNGNYSQQTRTTWSISLAPKREGTLIIPSFNIDGNVSDAIRIEVAQSTGSPAQDTPMMVTLETQQNQAYVGQQVLVNVELMAQENVSNLSGGQLSLPNAHLELLDQQSFRRVENGIAWQVIEWEYALIPEQSGTLEIPPQLFSGIVGSSSNFGFPDPFNQRGSRISARSNARQLEVLPPPETDGRPWFPAANVQVNTSWSGDTSQMRVGEPLTRTVEIIATGQRASAIPPLTQADSPDYKTYADQPQLLDRASASGIIGTRRESTAIVPSAEGELRIPEQRIAWWNTGSERWEETLLPAETLQILPAQQGSSFAPPDNFGLDQQESGINANVDNTDASGTPPGTAWYWPAISLFLVLVVLLQSWLLMGKRNKPRVEINPDERKNEIHRWRMVKRAIRARDAAKLRQEIINWARVHFPDSGVTTLSGLAKQSGNARLQELLAKLDAALYADSPAPDFDELDKALEELKQQSAKPSDSVARLKPLYPN